jgi:hypothetical protein
MPHENRTEFRGAEAVEYANTRLRKVKIAPEKWETEYEDPSTGEKWLLDYPHSELQGGGEPRLRKLKEPRMS